MEPKSLLNAGIQTSDSGFEDLLRNILQPRGLITLMKIVLLSV